MTAETKITTQNKAASLTVDLFGGAFVDFHLKKGEINPLSFKFSADQMPVNNRAGAPYQGHFLCLGRWGPPSEGEIKAGLPNHGQVANILWKRKETNRERILQMQAIAELEGLHIDRTIQLDEESPVYLVKEEVTNINPLGRFYNMVQHPTLCSPFLDESTIVDCNAKKGFNQAFDRKPEELTSKWPLGKTEALSLINLRSPDNPYNSVFSFITDQEEKFSWITAYSLTNRMILGYLWKRNDYPWIHLWQHWKQNKIKYRGIEFGTAGIHKPFKEILSISSEIFGEKTTGYLDAGEKVTRGFLSFITKVPEGFEGVSRVNVTNDGIEIKSKKRDQNIFITTSLKL